MALAENIYQLRTSAHLSREKLAEILNVSHQAVQKWENGTSTPDIRNIIKIAKYFGVSMDALLLDCDSRLTEERKSTVEIRPRYANLHEWEDYSGQLGVEYVQSLEEGRDIERYKDLFDAVSKMPAGNLRTRMADVIFDLVQQAGQRPGYAYLEPSALEEIRALRKPFDFRRNEPDEEALKQKIHGAWLGRVCGCLLGKSVEGIRTHELHPLLKETGNYPMHRYIRAADITDEIAQKYQFPLRSRPYADTIACMPSDDDTNYTVLAQEIVSKYGRDFTAHDVARAWMDSQPKKAYCSAERVAYCNFVKAYAPPESAVYKNPYREWIGAQIRGDYFGYINPGDPETAAEMAFRDASISHVKNGIYGDMWAAITEIHLYGGGNRIRYRLQRRHRRFRAGNARGRGGHWPGMVGAGTRPAGNLHCRCGHCQHCPAGRADHEASEIITNRGCPRANDEGSPGNGRPLGLMYARLLLQEKPFGGCAVHLPPLEGRWHGVSRDGEMKWAVLISSALPAWEYGLQRPLRGLAMTTWF